MGNEPEIKKLINSQYEQGNIVIRTIEGLQFCKLTDFMKQPVDGMLYDLNRDEATILTFIDDPKWVNDLAACKLIRQLSLQCAEMKEENERLKIEVVWYRSAAEDNTPRDAYRDKIKQLQEEVERLRSIINEVQVYPETKEFHERLFLSAKGRELFKAFSGKESKTE